MTAWVSYTVPCASAFRAEVLDLAERRRISVSDLARAVLLIVPEAVIAAHPDPGGPDRDDRILIPADLGEEPELPLFHAPWLDVQGSEGLAIPYLRRALALALALDIGAMTVGPADENGGLAAPRAAPRVERRAVTGRRREDFERAEFAEENARLRATVSVLAFDLLPFGVSSREEALYVLGFPPHARPEGSEIKARFRLLATVHHPDSGFGTHDRMSQLNAAMMLLRV